MPQNRTEGAADLDLENIARAREVIDPVFLDGPQYREASLEERLGRPVLVKVETLNPLRSFKGRGAEFAAAQAPTGAELVCASGGGNFGQAVAYAARRRGMAATVFVPATASPLKTGRMEGFGARVHRVDGDFQAAGAAYAADALDRVFLQDGRDPAVAEGAGTIGAELLRTGGFDAVVLPLGDGALITGVARWIRAHAPGVRIIGAGAAAAPALARAWRTGVPEPVAPSSTFAAGITIARPHPESVRRTRALVDEVFLVDDGRIRSAMHLAAETLGVLPEPAGAAGLAAIGAHGVPGPVATVITGANADLEHFRGLGG
ncbi:pyridoxal-phosphate dependent enzyme [Nocardiopsis sp. CNT-189]|uniref:threonine ammonia-lyase n=1 Tax=Nocardiopsis oceanisediminis TaxID=2816862 RepID=UPI003B2B5481